MIYGFWGFCFPLFILRKEQWVEGRHWVSQFGDSAETLTKFYGCACDKSGTAYFWSVKEVGPCLIMK